MRSSGAGFNGRDGDDGELHARVSRLEAEFPESEGRILVAISNLAADIKKTNEGIVRIERKFDEERAKEQVRRERVRGKFDNLEGRIVELEGDIERTGKTLAMSEHEAREALKKEKDKLEQSQTYWVRYAIGVAVATLIAIGSATIGWLAHR
jgi:hypothetical protein